MAAYAALTSLMGTIHLILQSRLELEEVHKEHLKVLYDKVGSLRELLENIDDEPTKYFQENVKNLAYETEDEMESQVRLIVMKQEGTDAGESLLEILHQAILDMDSVKEELIKQRKNNNMHVSTMNDKYDMVGYKTEAKHIIDQLTRRSSELEAISIVGKGGIGKTTFAGRIYSDRLVVEFFDVRCWVTVSNNYNRRMMLRTLLEDAIGVYGRLDNLTESDLADQLRRSLMYKRYLIVLDDMWDVHAWDDIRRCFPDFGNRSRVLLTTRTREVATYTADSIEPFLMRPLNPKESWELFCRKAFDQKICPVEFENVAREVVSKCNGLPLMISTVASVLYGMGSLDKWMEVAQSMASLVDTENDMVGYNIEQELMRGRLTGRSSQLEVISIAGMGGIGKSTFAKKMFYDPSIVSFFDVRGWITVSKDYSSRKMLLSLLRDAIGVKEELDKLSDGDLADRLQKSLKGRRYLIVVDDIWSIEAWDEVRPWFPEYSNKSRVLLTTRDTKVAEYASSSEDNHCQMRFLEPEESWTLFCQKAFDEKDCPVEIESVAKEVVENCKGLPLMISVVAGIMSSKRTLSEWREVAQSVSSLVTLDDDQRFSGVLALSYNHLPSHLKACFLYFGVFPKASEISVKKLIRLWVAEGLLDLKDLEGLEKSAANLLQDLIDKSLVIVIKKNFNGKIKTCRIHDLLHDFCLKESGNENLLYIANPETYEGTRWVYPQGRRWVSVPLEHGQFPPNLSDDPGSFHTINFDELTQSKTRSLQISSNKIVGHHELGLVHFELLRVLDLETMRLGLFPSELAHLVSLRYLAVMVDGIPEELPISNLLNLQTFMFPQHNPELSETMYLPNGIWEMSQLRHLHSTRMYLCSPPKLSANEVKYRVLGSLQSVSGLSPHCCTKETFEGINKLKTLGICGSENEFHSEPNCLDNLIYLPELEALSIVSTSRQPVDLFLRLPRPDSFPPNLKKLTLSRTWLSREDMTIISELPKLEVLQLKEDAYADNMYVWEVTSMAFPKLKFLLLEELYLKYWRAADDSFPFLECVIIRNCSLLQEIPEGFAESLKLQLIELHRCSRSLVTFSEQIQEDQENNIGNNILKVCAFDTKDVGFGAEEDL